MFLPFSFQMAKSFSTITKGNPRRAAASRIIAACPDAGRLKNSSFIIILRPVPGKTDASRREPAADLSAIVSARLAALCASNAPCGQKKCALHPNTERPG
jgi:hypothetical protein